MSGGYQDPPPGHVLHGLAGEPETCPGCEAVDQERRRITAAVEAINPTDITDGQGYRIDSADAMRRAVLAIVRGKA